MASTTLYLVRHGEQDPAAAGLSPSGRVQADQLGRRLRTISFSAIHHGPALRATQTAEIVAGHLPAAPRHPCDFVADRTPVPSPRHRESYPERWLPWLDAVPADERDEDATGLRAAVAHFGVVGDHDRHELLITHNFVVGWFVRHVMDAPEWRWIGLNLANCGITVVRWESDGPPRLVSFNDTGHLEQGLTIHRYRDADQAEVVRLNAYGLAAAGLTPSSDVHTGDLDGATAYRNGRAALLVGDLDGRVVAVGAVRPVSETTCEITRMRVDPAAQGRGFGKRMLTALEEEAVRLGYAEAVLLTGEDQHPAIDMYEAAGYVVVAREEHGGLAGVRLHKRLR